MTSDTINLMCKLVAINKMAKVYGITKPTFTNLVILSNVMKVPLSYFDCLIK